MDKLEQLLADLTAVDQKIDALLVNDELTDEQKTEHTALLAQRDKTTAAIKTEKARIAREEERQALADEQAARKAAAEKKAQEGNGRKVDHDLPGGNKKEHNGDGAKEIGVTKLPAQVKKFGPLEFFQGDVEGVSADVRAYRFGMWALAQLSIQMPNRFRFKDAVTFFEQNEPRWAAAHQSNNASGVHNLIPSEFGTDLILLRSRYGLIRRLFRNVPMFSDTRTDPRQQGGMTASFVNQGAAGSESNAVFDNVRLTAKDLMALGRISNQVNADAVLNFGDHLMGEIVYAFTLKEDQCGLLGTGTLTYGGITGVCTKLQSFDGAGTDSFGLATGTGNAYSELLLADFDNVVGKLADYADNERTCWVMHRGFYFGVCEKLVQAAGGVPAYEIREGNRRPRPIFKGYPVEFSPVMPNVEANSQVCALLGDFSLGAAFGDRQQDEIAFSEHATIGGENVFERNQIAIRGTERFDINVHDVGDASVAGPIVGLQTASG